MGLYGIAEVLSVAEGSCQLPQIIKMKFLELFPTKEEWGRSWLPTLRGSGIGFLWGLIPGPSTILSTFASYKLEKQLSKAWDETLFEQHYLSAVAQEEHAIAQHDAFAMWLGHLHDAFELVDQRSGEIRDPTTAAWLLQETLTALAQIDHPRVQDFVKTLRNHQQHLLTFLDWTAAALSGYRTALAQQWPDPRDQQRFERTVARHWRLHQALINGHHQWRAQALQAQIDFNDLIGGDPARQHLATRLLRLLDSAGHTSSLIECINGLLKSCLKNRQGFRNLQTLQAYLNLFVLWHNMRAYERGKRRGQSPYQIAEINPGSDDWLELLGFPAI